MNTVWYGVGGVKSTDTDKNNAITTYSYTTSGGSADPYWRANSITDPIGTVTWNTFPSGTPSTNLNSSTTIFNAGNSIKGPIYLTDGYGRLIDTQLAQSPTSTQYDTLTTTYGWTGNYRTVNTSEPCSTTGEASCPTVHTSEYDSLGRIVSESTTSNELLTHTYNDNDDLSVLTPAPPGETSTGKQVQNEYDGLGRLTSSCQVSADVNGNTPCGQKTNTSPSNGIVTTTAYSSAAGSTTVSSTRGSETRSQTFDALGRLIQKITPEGGTWNYYYDTSSSNCPGSGNSSGNLVCSKDPNGNEIIFGYDPLNRVTDVGAGVGGTTACRRFRYDTSSNGIQTQPSGSTIQNAAGRLVEAETDNCANFPNVTAITDEWFSYDKDGRITDIWEYTPHSGQYYHSVATFFENGAVKTLQLANPSFYTVTYSLDGEGRWNSLTDTTSGQNIVTGATFYPAANPATVSFTGSDNDKYTFDSYTGNMTQFMFTVGSKNETGSLTWNPNRTLRKLAITDGFNSGGTQTCHFNASDAPSTGYDDLVRLVGVDCGNGQWGQTFTFDLYDNLSKFSISGHIGSTYNPGYPTSPPYNNHCSICTYDADGNVTSDGSNNYGWNEFSKLKWTATSGTANCGSSGECITYDALGRMVENSSGGSYNQMWITQLGTIVQMAGSTIDYGYFPGPMGGTAIINGNSSGYGYLHKDWIGSARIVSNIAAHGITVDQAFSPYGEIYDQFGSNNSPYDMFAVLTGNFAPGVMRDTPNRELSFVGRWLSPDPAGSGWNQYAYPTNPNSWLDPSGLDDGDCTWDDQTNTLTCPPPIVIGGGGGGPLSPGGGAGGGSDCPYDTCVTVTATAPGDVPTQVSQVNTCTIVWGGVNNKDTDIAFLQAYEDANAQVEFPLPGSGYSGMVSNAAKAGGIDSSFEVSNMANYINSMYLSGNTSFTFYLFSGSAGILQQAWDTQGMILPAAKAAVSQLYFVEPGGLVNAGVDFSGIPAQTFIGVGALDTLVQASNTGTIQTDDLVYPGGKPSSINAPHDFGKAWNTPQVQATIPVSTPCL